MTREELTEIINPTELCKVPFPPFYNSRDEENNVIISLAHEGDSVEKLRAKLILHNIYFGEKESTTPVNNNHRCYQLTEFSIRLN